MSARRFGDGNLSETHRQHDQGGEESKDESVEHTVLDDNLASKCSLLEREDGTPDLLRRAKPEQHRRVQRVDVGDQARWCQKEEEKML